MYLQIALRHMHTAILHSMSIGYADGAYVYARMLARYVSDMEQTRRIGLMAHILLRSGRYTQVQANSIAREVLKGVRGE